MRDMSALMSSAAPLPMQMYSWLTPKYFAASRLLTLMPDGYSRTAPLYPVTTTIFSREGERLSSCLSIRSISVTPFT